MCKPFYNKEGNKIALLISHGYGAGWSTENDSRVAWDERVVNFWLQVHNNKNIIAALNDFYNNEVRNQFVAMFEEWGYPDVYFGGFHQIDLVWVPVGTYWRIGSYDGAEYLESFSPDRWMYFEERKNNE